MSLSRREWLAAAPLLLSGCSARRNGPARLAKVRVAPERVIRTIVGLRPFRPAGFVVRAEKLDHKVVVHNYGQVTPEFHRQFGEAGRFPFRRYQSMAGEAYGVRWLPLYTLSRDSPYRPAPPESPYSEIDPLYPDARQLARGAHPFPVPYVYRCYSMLIEPAVYLDAVLRDFLAARGEIVVREFGSARDLMSLRERLLFNCTGLGARDLFHGEELIPVRGQLTFLLPQPEIDYMTVGPGGIYMFPRHDGILLGGSAGRGVWDTQPDAATKERILSENAAVFDGMRGIVST